MCVRKLRSLSWMAGESVLEAWMNWSECAKAMRSSEEAESSPFFCFLLHLGYKPVHWCHLHSGWVSLEFVVWALIIHRHTQHVIKELRGPYSRQYIILTNQTCSSLKSGDARKLLLSQCRQFISQGPITIINTWDEQLRKRKGLFWLVALEVSICGWFPHCFWPYDEAQPHGWKDTVE